MYSITFWTSSGRDGGLAGSNFGTSLLNSSKRPLSLSLRAFSHTLAHFSGFWGFGFSAETILGFLKQRRNPVSKIE